MDHNRLFLCEIGKIKTICNSDPIANAASQCQALHLDPLPQPSRRLFPSFQSFNSRICDSPSCPPFTIPLMYFLLPVLWDKQPGWPLASASKRCCTASNLSPGRSECVFHCSLYKPFADIKQRRSRETATSSPVLRPLINGRNCRLAFRFASLFSFKSEERDEILVKAPPAMPQCELDSLFYSAFGESG